MQPPILEIVCIARKISSSKKASAAAGKSRGGAGPKVALTKSFHFVASTAFAAGTTLDILTLTGGTPGGLDSLGEQCVAYAQLSDLYRYWRPTRLRAKFYQTAFVAANEAGGFLAACFVANEETSPTTLGQLDGLPFSLTQRPPPGAQAAGNDGIYTPPLELDVPLANLQSLGGWYMTNADSTQDTDFDGPGLIRLISLIANSSSIMMECWVVCEFANPLDPTTIAPAERQRLVSKLRSSIPVVSGKERSSLIRLEDVVDLLQHPDEP